MWVIFSPPLFIFSVDLYVEKKLVQLLLFFCFHFFTAIGSECPLTWPVTFIFTAWVELPGGWISFP